MRKHFFLLYIFILILLMGCNGNKGGGLSGPNDCDPFTPRYEHVSPMKLNKYDNIYFIRADYNSLNIESLVSVNDGCSVEYFEIAAVKNTFYYVWDEYEQQPEFLSDWVRVVNNQPVEFILDNVSGLTTISLCARAVSNLHEVSQWKCDSRNLSSATTSITPPSSLTPISNPPGGGTSGGSGTSSGGSGGGTDSTAPSTPGSVVLSNNVNSISISFNGSIDSESGVSRYWSAIFDSTFQQITNDKELSSSARSDAYSDSN